MPKKKEESIIEQIEENVEEAGEVVEKIIEKVENIVEGKEKKVRKTKKKEKISKEEIKQAEKESVEESEVESLEARKKKLLEKVAKLKSKVSGEEISTEELKEKVKDKKKEDTLVPLDDYVRTGIYLGTRVVTPDMRPFVYRRRADGLAIFNTDIIDEKLKEGIAYLIKFDAKGIIVVCKRQAGWKAVKKFSEVTGIRAFTKKYPAGILTNTSLPNFFENELTIVCDSWLDKNALNDTIKVHKKTLMICDTNNFSRGANQIIIGNNKSPKSLGIIFYLLAKGYCKAKGIDEKEIPELDWWLNEED